MKYKTPGAMSMLLAAAALNGAALPGHAQDATATTSTNMTTETNPMTAPIVSPEEEPWRFGITVPLWAPQVDGNVTARGHQRGVNISFDQLKDHLDTSLSLALNAQKGKFGVFTSVGYMRFSAGVPQANAGLKFLIVNGGVSYLLLKTENDHPSLLAVTAGVRYWYAEPTLTIPALGLFYVSHTFNVVDPVFGLRGTQYLTRKLHLDAAGDFGGFDANNDSDWTWSASGMATYDFATWLSISAGYSAIGLTESNGSGAGKFGVDLVFNGLAAAITVRF